MGFLDSGITVYVRERDTEGRDAGDTIMVLKEGKKDGVYLVNTSKLGFPVVKRFDPVSVSVFRKADAQDKSMLGRALVGAAVAGSAGAVVGGLSGIGKQDTWFIAIRESNGLESVYRIKNQREGLSMKKRIEKHIA